MTFRGEISNALAALALQHFLSGELSIGEDARRISQRRLGEVAEEFGWAKTYDAEYVALAKADGCRLVTLDSRLRRDTDRLGFVVTPDELA
jgi:predicted nucleic acid-binding protein